MSLCYTLATITTWFDLLNSTIAPQQLLDTAQRLRIAAIGVVDRGTTLGHVPLARAAQDTGVHLVYGTTVLLGDGYPLRLLARDETGYRNLCRLIAMQNRQPRLPWEMVQTHHHGLYLLCGGRRGRLWHDVAAEDDRVLWTLAKLQALAEREEHFVVEVQQYDTDGRSEHLALRRLLDLIEHAGARAIATHDVHVLQPEEGSKHRLVSAIEYQSTFWADDDRLPPWRARQPSRYRLPTPREWYRKWEGLEHLVAGSAAVLQDCQVGLLGRKRFPGASLPASQIYDQLWRRAFNGLKQRYPQVSPPLIQRLTYEVDEVMAQEVGAFLLFAAELVARASVRGIKMVLQGSGTGSLLCYALAISPVDPLTSEAEALVFERFCGRHRGLGDLPDLDFGVPAGKETAIREILIEMFGAERVAHLAAVTTLRDRGAIRTAAAAFGWDRSQIRILHRKLKDNAPLDRYEQMVVAAGEQIEGQPHHVMRHASGILIADEPMADLYGVMQTDEGPLLLANKDDVEALQLLKFDILPWYLLAIYDQAEATIHAEYYPKPDVWHVSGEDALTGDMLEQADTRAIPYLQSPAMMTLLRALRVRSEAGIAVALGALRPGASTTRDRLLAAIHGGSTALPGWELLTPEHQQVLDEVLRPSHGAFIFDEDLLRVAHRLGFSFADAERLRKALTQGDTSGPLVNKFRAAGLANGWSDREISVVLHWFSFIQRYTFAHGHAVALAHAAWRVARLSRHYPPHFYAAVLDHLGLGVGGGMYPVLVYVIEARRHGVQVVGPTVNGPWHSQPDGRSVRGGLLLLQRAINVTTLERIHTAARQHPFTSIADLCARIELTHQEYERLIAAGALDELVPSRRQARWEVQVSHIRPLDQGSLLTEVTWPCPPGVEVESIQERAREEYETLGFPVSVDHPLDLHRAELKHVSLVCSEQLRTHVGRQVTVAGVIVAGRRIRTTNDRLMAFASVCDRNGVLEATLFEAAAECYAELLQNGSVVVATGMVTQDMERGIGLEVRSVRTIA